MYNDQNMYSLLDPHSKKKCLMQKYVGRHEHTGDFHFSIALEFSVPVRGCKKKKEFFASCFLVRKVTLTSTCAKFGEKKLVNFFFHTSDCIWREFSRRGALGD